MGAAEWHTVLNQPLRDIGGQGEPLGGELRHALVVEGHRAHHAADGRQEDGQGVDGVEDRFLVLLQVPVVGQGQGLEGGEQPGQVADEAPGLAAGELGHVRVLLLRHDGRARGVGVVQGDEVELLGVPDDDLLAQARDVHRDHREDEAQLGDDVAGGRAVDGVLHGRLEAEVGGHGIGVHAERVARQRAGAVGAHGGTGVPVLQALDVTHERPGVSQQLVGDEHRLGVLHVGASGHDGVGGLGGLVDEGIDDVEDESGDVAGLVAQVHADEGGDLVVAAAPGTQTAPQIVTGALDEAALQGGVDVLVGGLRDEDAGDDVGLETLQGLQHAGQLARIQQTGLCQGAGVGPGAGDVVAGQAPVEVGAHRQGGQRVGGSS